MGKTFLSGVWLVGVVCVAVWGGPRLSLEEELFDFGSVIDGTVVVHTFPLTSAGDAPVTILQVSHPCGCTTYELDKETIDPGETARLTVRFNTAGYSRNPQPVEQTITVYSNDPAGPHRVILKGIVLSSGEEPAASRESDPLGEGKPAGILGQPVPPKPTFINLQVDLVTPEDAENVLPILELMESYGWRTTVYVTGEIALAYPNLVKEIHDRGHQIGVLGWEAGEDLLSLSEEELYDRLENAFLVVRAAVGNMRPQYIADFKPQGYLVNETLLRVLERLEVRSCTGIFPKGPDHPYHLEDTHAGLVAIPLAFGIQLDEALVDNFYLARGGSREFFADIRRRYDDNRLGFKPFAVAIHPSLLVNDEAGILSLKNFLDYVEETTGQLAVVDQLTVRANPFIDWIRIEAPEEARAGEEITVTVRYYANCYCPMYYFMVYGCEHGWLCSLPLVRGLYWEPLWAEQQFVPVGEHEFSFKIRLPLRTGNYTYHLTVVGQACHGGPCWPTYSETIPAKYDAISTTTIQVRDYNAKFLFVPVNWVGTQSDFETKAHALVRNFLEVTPLRNCPGVSLDDPNTWPVLMTVLDTETQNLEISETACTGFQTMIWNLRGGLLGEIKRFVEHQGVERSRYNIIVGLSDQTQMCVGIMPDGKRYAGVSNQQDTVWILADTQNILGYNYVLAHEVGHIEIYGGLKDEYCSRDAGSIDRRCNSSTDQPNPLCSDRETCGCDCPSDGVTQSSTGELCCNYDSNRTCTTVNYGVCCRGNKADGGRCIMANATSTNATFCYHCQKRMESMTRFSCAPVEAQTALTLSSNGDLTNAKRMIYIDLYVTPDDEVTEDFIEIEEGEFRPFPYCNPDGAYNFLVYDINSSVVSQYSFDLYFDYAEPPHEEDGSVVAHVVPVGSFTLSVGIPFTAGMYSVALTHNQNPIYSRVLPVSTIIGAITTLEGELISDAVITARGPDFEFTRSDAQGRYVLAITESGEYIVTVQPSDPNLMPTSQTIQVELEQVYTLDFTLERSGSIAGRVTDAAGNPVTEAWIHPQVFEPPYYKTSEAGEYLMPGLPPGTYTIAIEAPGYGPWHIFVDGMYRTTGNSVTVTVELGRTTRVDFSQQPPSVFYDLEYPSQEEAEEDGWEFAGLWHLTEERQCAEFIPDPTPFPSPSHAARFGVPGDPTYAAGAPPPLSATERAQRARLGLQAAQERSYGELITPVIEVAGQRELQLTFHYFRDVEHYQLDSFDRTYVQVSFDGGPWETVWLLDSMTPAERTWMQAGPVPIRVPEGATSLRLKFVFDSVDGYYNEFLGWFIDDIEIRPPEVSPLTILTTCEDLPPGQVGHWYEVQLQASGGVSPYSWSWDCPDSPPGLSLDPQRGRITGTPTQPGAFCCPITVADSIGNMARLDCCILVEEAPDCACMLLLHDFATLEDWEATGLWHWTLGSECQDCHLLEEGFAYFGRDDACNYDLGTGVQGYLTSCEIVIPDCVEAVALGFKYFRQVESYLQGSYDRTFVQVSFSGGPWQTVWQRDSRDPSPECGEAIVGPILVPEGAETLQIRFGFDSVDMYFNAFPGWAIDDVWVGNAACVDGLGQATWPMLIEPEVGPREPSFLVVPNPVRDVYTTTFVARGVEAEAIRVEIYDLAGRLVWEGEAAGNELVWHTDDLLGRYLANGVYLYRAYIKVAGEWIVTQVQKVVILR